MQIQINTDHNIKGHQTFVAKLTSSLEDSLRRVSEHITRIEVHLSDENGGKNTQIDKRCMMEARLEGRQPIAVTHNDTTVEKAAYGAVDKLISMIETIIGKQRDHSHSRTDSFPLREDMSEAI